VGLTVSSVTTANSTSSSATLSITGVSAAVGDWLVVFVGSDNSGTSGANPITTIEDSAGNTWTQRTQRNNTPGSTANDGVSSKSWTAPITSALSSGTITINFSPNVASKAALVKKIVPDAGERVVFGSNGGANGVTSTPTVTSGTIANGDTVFGFVAIETGETVTADSDTTRGNWSTQQTAVASTGTNTTSIRVASQQKTVTAEGTQTYNLTIANARDWVINWMSFTTEIAGFGALLAGKRNMRVIS
jgi:copper chaperone CopZ